MRDRVRREHTFSQVRRAFSRSWSRSIRGSREQSRPREAGTTSTFWRSRLDIVGAEHHEVGVVVDGNLAALALPRGELDAAEGHARSALAIKEDALGPNGPELAPTLSTLGTISRRRGDPVETAGLHRRARDLLRPVVGSRPPAPGHLRGQPRRCGRRPDSRGDSRELGGHRFASLSPSGASPPYKTHRVAPLSARRRLLHSLGSTAVGISVAVPKPTQPVKRGTSAPTGLFQLEHQRTSPVSGSRFATLSTQRI